MMAYFAASLFSHRLMGMGLLFFVFPGYSYTEDEMGVPVDQSQVGIEVHAALTQLLHMFPEIRDNPLFVAGHSYGGNVT